MEQKYSRRFDHMPVIRQIGLLLLIICASKRSLYSRFCRKTDKILKNNVFYLFEQQYFFSHDWLNFMIAVLRALRIENVLCVGAPRLFDFLTALRHKNLSIPHFLLDLDCRLEMFYSPSSFARFSVLNGHFFSSEGEVCANAFMKSCQGRSLIFCDPPFGAFMQPLVESLKKLKDGILYSGEGREVFLMITVPYFIGKKLIQAAPELKMLDYKVGSSFLPF